MDATYRALAAASELEEFTVSMLAERADIKETTARTILNRHRHLFATRSGDSGRRGGQPQIWSVKASAVGELRTLVGNIANRFEEDQWSEAAADADFEPSSVGRLRVPGINRQLATAEDLVSFAQHLAAREFLPHVISRLLVATPGVTAVSVRAGDAVGLIGFDGRVEASVGTPFVPEGHSVWEVGTGKDPQKKANHDLRVRTKEPADADPSETAFVVVSMRRFDDKDGWASKARARTPWRQIRVIDADDLQAWLEATPQVHIWASEQMGLRPLDAVSLHGWWEAWLLQTEPQLPVDLPLAGRQKSAEELRDALKAAGQVLGVYSGSREEAMVFIAAALLVDDADATYSAEANPAASAVVVRDRRAWDRLVESARPLTLLPLFDNPNIGAATRNGHNVLIPMGAGDERESARIDLPPIDLSSAADAFRRADPNLDASEAHKRAADARRSLAALRRRLAVNPARERPAWAAGEGATVLAPLVLIGSWQAESPADQAVVAEIANRRYEEIERTLRVLAATEDPPFVRVGSRWQLAAPVDAWALLSYALTSADLGRWRSVAARVLGEDDPTSSLSEHERLMCSVRGVRREFSPALRTGLARSTALLASAPGLAPDGGSWASRADDLVRDLLGEAPDPRRWLSVEDVLPLLSEASPRVFLRAVERGVAGKEPPLRSLFTDAETGSWGSHSPHTRLLWALEVLCWPEEYVAEACEALAQLAEIDPGGRLSNRPAESLRRVLLPWHPQTTASLDARMELVRALVARHPRVGWQLVLGLLPQPFDSSHPTYRPLFRDWKSQESGVTFVERLGATQQLVGVALENLQRSPASWTDFVQVLPNLPPGDLDRCLTALEETDLSGVEPDVRLVTWRALSETIARHRQFPSAQWSLPEDWLGKFDRAAAKWEPEELPQRHASLFDWHPDLPGTDQFDHAAYEEALAGRRREVITLVMAENGIAGLRPLIQEAPVPGLVGAAIADVAGATVMPDVLPLIGEDGAAGAAARGFVLRMSDLGGDAWVDEALRTAPTLPEVDRVSLYLALPSTPRLWQVVDHETPAVRDRFWKSTGIIGIDAEDVEELVQRFIEHRRPWSAIHLLSLHLHRPGRQVPNSLIEMALRAVTDPDISESHQAGSLDYEVGLLLDRLESGGASDDLLFQFEWFFFPLLQYTRRPRAIFRALAEQPELFVGLVTAAFRAEGEPPAPEEDASIEEAPPNEVAAARLAYMVLREWREPPGLTDDRTVDATRLAEWVTAVRTQLAAMGRLKIGDECLGQVLSGSPAGADEVWPAEPIRDLLEELDSESLAQGLSIGRYNSRGVTTRGVFDGGKQENALAAQYEGWSKKVMVRWPKTGRLLREMAESYKAWARHQDAVAEEWANDA
jgi:hypothetical protein